jgi:nucleotidyltransferase substrate binding protein (TIGR01987 family)
MTQSPKKDIRWKQRFQNFSPAFDQLKAAVELSEQRSLSNLEKQGLIQAFEFTHELAWNVMKDYFDYQGANQIAGSRDATREAFNKGLIADGDEWMEMIRSRNQTTHTYNKKIADDISEKIIKTYFFLFSDFSKKMSELLKK